MVRFLTVERNKQLFVKLYPEASAVTREHPPVATFIIKLVSSSSPTRKTIVHPGLFSFIHILQHIIEILIPESAKWTNSGTAYRNMWQAVEEQRWFCVGNWYAFYWQIHHRRRISWSKNCNPICKEFTFHFFFFFLDVILSFAVSELCVDKFFILLQVITCCIQ